MCINPVKLLRTPNIWVCVRAPAKKPVCSICCISHFVFQLTVLAGVRSTVNTMIKYAHIWKLPKQAVVTKQSLDECSHTQTAYLTNTVWIKNIHAVCMCVYRDFLAVLGTFLVSPTLAGLVVQRPNEMGEHHFGGRG